LLLERRGRGVVKEVRDEAPPQAAAVSGEEPPHRAEEEQSGDALAAPRRDACRGGAVTAEAPDDRAKDAAAVQRETRHEEERGARGADEALRPRPRGEAGREDVVGERDDDEEEDDDPREVDPDVDAEDARDADRAGHPSEHTGRVFELPTVPELAAMIDHAVLKPTQTERDVVDACTLARHEHIASVCVKPFYVPVTARLLKGSGVLTSTVIGFPHGGQSPEVKVTTATTALRDGASELDMVINIGALIDKDYQTIEREVALVVGLAHASEATVKVILETGYLDDAQKAIAAQLAA